MTRSKMIAVAVVLVAIVSAFVIDRLSQSHVDAQDSSSATRSKAKSIPAEGFSPTAVGQSIPIFFVDEVIKGLSAAVDHLTETKQIKNSEELRKQLDRTSFSIKFASPQRREVAPQELYRRVAESIYLVAGMTKPTEDEQEWKTAFSTAFAVHEDGVLSTSAHVFDHDDQDHGVVVMDFQGKVIPIVELLAVDRKKDTCLFRIAAKDLKPLPLGKELPPGSPVRVIGHPGDSFFFFSAGHIANYERDDEGIHWMNITADFGQGSSGGPVMDEAGNVVGQVSRTFTLYAGGTSSNRQRRRAARAADEAASDDDKMKQGKHHEEEAESSKKQDPQMVFKACTPVSSIQALAK